MSVDERAVIAAGNNADLYEAMFATQGLDYNRLPFAFVGLDSPPRTFQLPVMNPVKIWKARAWLISTLCDLRILVARNATF